MIKRALISVSDKSGTVEFARGLAALGVEILSTGGTARALRAAGIPVREVSEVTGFPEILDGRVKTLHPRVHGGILAVRKDPAHMAQLTEHGIGPIDLVAANLYPFRETVQQPEVDFTDAVENIDIGGPSMIRAAAKNFQDVVVIVSPGRYAQVLGQLQQQGDVAPALRFELMQEAFQHTAEYDQAIAGWMAATGRGKFAAASGSATAAGPQARPNADAGAAAAAGGDAAAFPSELTLHLTRLQDLRYGENPHQRAAFYRMAESTHGAGIAGARQLHGKELSFNNINDAHAALELVKEFTEPCAVAVKHTNPCGVAVADTLAEAYRRAHDADPVSIFGGIVALNRPCDAETAAEIKKIFVEIVLAPSFAPEALAILTKKKDIRLLEVGPLGQPGPAGFDIKRVHGGVLVQDWDNPAEDPAGWQAVTERQPDDDLRRDLWFAWRVCKHVKSNAIVLAKGGRTLGVGAGQMNRIDAARYAINRAAADVQGAVLASDAFFPFPDVVAAAGAVGVAAIAQPGGSIRDDDSIAKANELGIAMVFTGKRHFRH